MFLRTILMLAAVFMTAVTAGAQTHPATDADAIRHVIKSTWDRPAEPVNVPAVAVVSGYAIAGWTQGTMGGRALLRKKADAWSIVLCAGDQLRNADTLRQIGISEPIARQLAADLAQAERALPPKDVALFSRFEGLVTMDQHSGHNH